MLNRKFLDNSLKILNFEETDPKEWNDIITKLGFISYQHNYYYISYHLSCDESAENLSFILFDENKPIALVPICLCKKNLSFPTCSCPYPLVSKQIEQNKLPTKMNMLKQISDIINS